MLSSHNLVLGDPFKWLCSRLASFKQGWSREKNPFCSFLAASIFVFGALPQNLRCIFLSKSTPYIWLFCPSRRFLVVNLKTLYDLYNETISLIVWLLLRETGKMARCWQIAMIFCSRIPKLPIKWLAFVESPFRFYEGIIGAVWVLPFRPQKWSSQDVTEMLGPYCCRNNKSWKCNWKSRHHNSLHQMRGPLFYCV